MLCLKSLSADNPQSPKGLGGALIFKKSLLLLIVTFFILSLTCFSVSAYNEVSFGNLKFGSPSFRTRISDSGGYSEPSDDVITEYNQSSTDDSGISIYTYTVKSGGSFGGSLDYYRCMRGSISVPVTNGKKYLYMTVTPYIYNGSSGVSSFDISLGDTTYFSNGGVTSNPFLNVESTREGTSVKFKIDLETYDTIYFQIGTKIYSTWTDYTLAFSDISLVSEDGSSLIINNQNSNTDREIQADKENTQAIIDNQNELAEKEKNEINSSGNDSIDSALQIMPNYNLGDVFDGFINVMEYDGIDCEFSIPEIYIPSIVNITPKVVLYKGSVINFKDFFEMIPITILHVVRAFLTVALILFCFKELWEDIGAILSGDGIKIMREGTKDE